MKANKVICCRLCNDTGIKAETAFRMFERLMGHDDGEERWCICAVGAYRRHKHASKVRA